MRDPNVRKYVDNKITGMRRGCVSVSDITFDSRTRQHVLNTEYLELNFLRRKIRLRSIEK